MPSFGTSHLLCFPLEIAGRRALAAGVDLGWVASSAGVRSAIQSGPTFCFAFANLATRCCLRLGTLSLASLSAGEYRGNTLSQRRDLHRHLLVFSGASEPDFAHRRTF